MSKQLTIAALTAALCLLTAANTLAATTFNVDFSDNQASGGFPGGASAWNTIAVPADMTGANYPILSDSTGSFADLVTLHGTGTITDNPNTGTNMFSNATGGPSWVTTDGSLSNTEAAQDAFYTSNGATASFTLEITNLPGDLVTVDLFSSRVSGSAVGFFEYSIDNLNWLGFNVLEKNGVGTSDAYWTGNDTSTLVYRSSTDGNTNARYMSASLTSPGGLLYIRARDISSGQFTVLNALRLTVSESPLPPAPEPSSLLLLGLGCVVVGRRASRAKRA